MKKLLTVFGLVLILSFNMTNIAGAATKKSTDTITTYDKVLPGI